MSMRNNNRLLALSAAAALMCTAVTAQNARPTAFTNARIHTVSGDIIERGTLVIRNDKIEAVSADAVIPAGAKVVDATGKTIMPGLVSAWSRAGLNAPTSRSNTPTRSSRRGRMLRMSSGGGGGSAKMSAATKVMDRIYVRQPIFGKLLELGITSLALNPNGYGFPGLGAVLNPDGKTREALTQNDEAFVQIGMQRNSSAKKMLGDSFEKAKKIVAEREKPPAPPAKKPEANKPEAAKPANPAPKPTEGKEPPKPAPKPTPSPKPTPKPKEEGKKQEPKPAAKPAPAKKAPPKRKDPNLEVLADLLQGKRRAIVQISSAADLLHWRTVVKDDIKFPRMVAVTRHDTSSGTMDMVIDHLMKWECSVLLPPSLTTLPRTAHLIHPAKKLHDAGIEIGFIIGERPTTVRSIFVNLMELVRCGLPADVAIKAITHVPAKALGIDKRTGTLEAGKDADFLVFDGDPLSPTSKLEQVWLRGSHVTKDEAEN